MLPAVIPHGSMRAMKLFASFALLALFACSKDQDPVAPSDPVAKPAEPTATPTEPAPADKPAAKPEDASWVKHVTPTVDHPVVGKPAPDFKLKGLDGKEVVLASLKGKTVVLEWFNPGCPFVKKAHGVGSLVDTAQRHAGSGIVWLAINSGGAGKQGAEPKQNVDAAKTWKMAHPVLLDPAGTVGKAYGATNTPHMFVIDKSGTVIYGGAIDNSPDGEKKSPEGGNLINYVDAALEDIAAGRPVRTPVTKAYGCSVKYAAS
jgi:peroxiredoxin